MHALLTFNANIRWWCAFTFRIVALPAFVLNAHPLLAAVLFAAVLGTANIVRVIRAACDTARGTWSLNIEYFCLLYYYSSDRLGLRLHRWLLHHHRLRLWLLHHYRLRLRIHDLLSWILVHHMLRLTGIFRLHHWLLVRLHHLLRLARLNHHRLNWLTLHARLTLCHLNSAFVVALH